MAIIKQVRLPSAPIRPPQAPVAAPIVKAPMRGPVPAPKPSAAALNVAAAQIVAAGQTLVKRGPGRPSKAEIEARTIGAVQAPAMAPTAAPRPSVDPALVASVEALKTTVQEQNALIAKLKGKPSKYRTWEEIADGAENGIAADDWRLAYHGTSLSLHPFEESGKDLIQLENRPPVSVVLALPRFSDYGEMGSQARALGQLAVYVVTEDERYERLSYLFEHELVALRAN